MSSASNGCALMVVYPGSPPQPVHDASCPGCNCTQPASKPVLHALMLMMVAHRLCIPACVHDDDDDAPQVINMLLLLLHHR